MDCSHKKVSRKQCFNSELRLGRIETNDDPADYVQSRAAEPDIKEGSDSGDEEDAWDECSTTEQTVYSDFPLEDDAQLRTTRELKDERRLARNQARFAAALKEREIRRVEQVLHPESANGDRSLDNADPLKSPTITNNLAFNPSTFNYASLRTDIHTKKVQKNNGSPTTPGSGKRQSQDDEVTMFVQQLGVDVRKVKNATKERQSLLSKLFEAIRQDLEVAANDDKEFMKRMAGYWRYVSRRTYNHMVQKNEIWDWETGAKLEKLEYMDEDEDTAEADYSSMSDNPSDDDTHNDEATSSAIARLTLNVRNGKCFPAAPFTSQTFNGHSEGWMRL